MDDFVMPLAVYAGAVCAGVYVLRTGKIVPGLCVGAGSVVGISWLCAAHDLCLPAGSIPGGLFGQWIDQLIRTLGIDSGVGAYGVTTLIFVIAPGPAWWYRLGAWCTTTMLAPVLAPVLVLIKSALVGKIKPARSIPIVPEEETSTRTTNRVTRTTDTQVIPYAVTLPPVTASSTHTEQDQDQGQELAAVLQDKLQKFGVFGKVTQVMVGPVVTRLLYEPRADIKVSKLLAREHDVALALKALSLRILAPLPGTQNVAFEIARAQTSPVLFGSLLHKVWARHQRTPLPLLIGVDTIGKPVMIDLAEQPHMLIAGTTGSGKSLLIHSFIMSLLYRHGPDELKLLLIDPKFLEYGRYRTCPHLIAPVAHTAQDALKVLNYAVHTMEQRYQRMEHKSVRHAAVYHARYGDMPPIVVIVDELADLMMTSGKDVERLLVRLAQMARAASIHVIIATQRPSVDVVTGLLKSNFPARIALKVNAKVDSRTILDQSGAEKLIGKGDMLYLQPQGSILRAHGAYVREEDIERVVREIEPWGPPLFDSSLTDDTPAHTAFADPVDEALLQEMVQYLQSQQQISISLLQRKFRIGYNRSARLMQELEDRGHVVPYDGSSKMRKVLHKSSSS